MTRAELLAVLRKLRLAAVTTAPQAAVVGIAVTDALDIIFDTLTTSRNALTSAPIVGSVSGRFSPLGPLGICSTTCRVLGGKHARFPFRWIEEARPTQGVAMSMRPVTIVAFASIAFGVSSAAAFGDRAAIATTRLEVRSAPDVESKLIGSIRKGRLIDYGECNDGWCRTQIGSKIGYVLQGLLDDQTVPIAPILHPEK